MLIANYFLLLAGALSEPGQAIDTLTSANGHGAVVYSTTERKVTRAYAHLYKQANASTPEVPNLVYDVYGGIRRGTQGGTWLGEWTLGDADYDGDGLRIRASQRVGDLQIQTRVTAPLGLARPAFVVTLTVRNLGLATVSDAQAAVLLNFHVGGGAEGTQAERIVWNTTHNAFLESGARADVAFIPLDTPLHHAASPSNPYTPWKNGAALTDVNDSNTFDDAVAALDWQLPSLAAQQEVVRGLLVVMGEPGSGATLLQEGRAWSQQHADGAAWETALTQEWSDAVSIQQLPPGLSDDERMVARRSLAVLRGAQVRETVIGAGGPGNLPHGQIPAALPPGIWNITWVRDLTYAVRGLIDVGEMQAARDAMDFLLRGPAGDYEEYVGRPYGLSVVRTYGGGAEESDQDSRGYNIELDGFGLLLTELAREHALSGSSSLATQRYALVKNAVADPITDCVDGATGLVQADSSIWETHWTDRRRYAYTSLTAAAGLRDWADVAEELGDPADATRYRNRANAIVAAMEQHLVVNQVLVQSMEDLGNNAAFDVSVIEAFNRDVLDPSGAVANATLDALKGALTVPTGNGLHRNDDGGDYDRAEWIVVDLWFSTALRRTGRVAEADALLAWVTAAGVRSRGLIPELLDRDNANAAGAWPMVGFGAGAYLHALWERERMRPRSDASVVVDAAIPVDAAAGVDASLPRDAAVPPVDAAVPRDASTSDSALPDATVVPDASQAGDASVPDAAVRPDAGRRRDAAVATSDAGRTDAPEGCQCQGGGGAAPWLGFLVVVAWWSRRGRARRLP
ncbi:MAG: glycoside hydrolase family 15 protein [Myxococcota bacterium]